LDQSLHFAKSVPTAQKANCPYCNFI